VRNNMIVQSWTHRPNSRTVTPVGPDILDI
jgi:hypothetical protein